MDRLGQILLERGWVERSKLRRAQENQDRVGGHLGTCLLEAKAVTEEELGEALGLVYDVPPTSVEALREISQEALDALPAKVAERCHAVPFELSGRTLYVAMLDPEELTCQDELAFASGMRLDIHVASEPRIAEALELHYGVECPSRLATLVEQLNRARFLWRNRREAAQDGQQRSVVGAAMGAGFLEAPQVEEAPQLPESPLPEPPRDDREDGEGKAPGGAPERPGRRPRRQEVVPESIALTPEENRALYRKSSSPRQSEGAGPTSPFEAALAEAHERLEEASHRDEVGEALVDFLSSLFLHAGILIARADRIEGWVPGRGVDPERFRRLSISLEQPSAFLNLKAGSPFHLGPLADIPAHRALVHCWDGRLPRGSLLLPVRLRDRLVAVLYGDRGESSLTGLPTERIQQLADHAAKAFERCIVLKKKGAG